MIFENSLHNLKHQPTKEMFRMPVLMSSVESLGLWVRASVVGVVSALKLHLQLQHIPVVKQNASNPNAL